MSEQLLLRHAERWAAEKRRPIDVAIVETALDLRQTHDDQSPQEWPPGSVSDLLLRRWPAHGPLDLPDLDVLRDSLDTFWRFLRATGRMSAKSASPAELLKEARRALRDMPAACADRSNFSQGRVLMDHGRSVGIDLEGAESTEELQARLNQIQESWNSLPVDERRRLMPDPSPKSARGQAWTDALNNAAADDEDEFREGDPKLAARDARAAPYVLACLGLADWVGHNGKPVTARGLLKPTVAREAYLDLNIFAWENAYLPYAAGAGTTDPEVLALLERTSANSWRSAGDCDGLDRLWWSCDASRLVDIRSSKAVRGARLPTNDDEWLDLGLELVLCLALRFAERVMPLTGCLLIQAVSEEPVPLGAVKEWWWERHPAAATLPGDDTFWRNLRDGQVDWVVNMFDDTGLWVRHGESLEITEFGRVFAVVMANAAEDGAFDDY